MFVERQGILKQLRAALKRSRCAAEIASSLQVTGKTVRRYLDQLSGAHMVRQLPSWAENVGKRVVKAPKVYIRDSGMLHTLLRIESQAELESHPKFGASWEGFALEELMCRFGERQAYFWATHGGAELDLLIVRGTTRLGFEIKLNEAPKTTKSMHIAQRDLNLDHLWVVYPGDKTFPLTETITAISLPDVLALSTKTTYGSDMRPSDPVLVGSRSGEHDMRCSSEQVHEREN